MIDVPRARIQIAITFLIICLKCDAEEKWIKLATRNFELYTTQKESKARETILYFEQLREFFEGVWKVKPDPTIATRIVLFSNENQYKPYRPNEIAAGFFHPGIDRDWIVMGGYDDHQQHLITHEYVHLMVRQAGLHLPIWMNEGVAEVYATFKPIGPKVTIGEPILVHFQIVQGSKWIPLARVLTIEQDSEEYNRRAHAGPFYAESWGLTHLLMFSEEYKGRWSEILRRIADGEPSGQVIQQVTGKPLTVVEKDLQAYFHPNGRFYAGQFAFKSERAQLKPPAEHVSPEESDAVLTGLMVSSRQGSAARSPAARLLADAPKEWRAHEVMAYLEFREGNHVAAAKEFAQAFELGASSPKAYYDAARVFLYSGNRDTKAIEYLKKAIELFPEWTEARLQLIEQYVYIRKPDAALTIAMQLSKIDAKNASRLFRARALAAAMMNDDDTARKEAANAVKWARTSFDQSEAQRINDYLAGRTAGQANRAANPEEAARLIADQISGSVERFDKDARESGIREFRIVGDPERKEFNGRLVDLACNGKQAILTLSDDNDAPLVLEIQDPSMVNIQVLRPGEQATNLELTCGKQDQKVRVFYVENTGTKTAGLVRAIEFR